MYWLLVACINYYYYINVAFKSDKLMDALFFEGQSAPQSPQTLFDADFEGLASNAEVYIFNQDDSQE